MCLDCCTGLLLCGVDLGILMPTTGITLMLDVSSPASATFVDSAAEGCSLDDDKRSPFGCASELPPLCWSVAFIELAASGPVGGFEELSSLKL